MRVLELGSYIIPAYAGMLLAEQGHQVTKWIGTGPDPIQQLDHHADELWAWINHGKTVETRHAATVADLQPGQWDAVIDNVRASTWERWGVDPAELAEAWGIPWVSMRADVDERSFDLLAQARAWGDHLGLLPAYLGDTTGGLWLAFKVLTAPPGHHVLRQAACLAKLVEGELVVDPPRNGRHVPWESPLLYGPDRDGNARVVYRDEVIIEPLRDSAWRRRHLAHRDGRYII